MSAAEQEEPVRHRVQPRERHVARADHQRHEEVAEAGEDRHDDEEDHRRPVDREELVVAVAHDEVLVRRGELAAHQQRQDSAADEEEQARRDVEDPIRLWSVVTSQLAKRPSYQAGRSGTASG